MTDKGQSQNGDHSFTALLDRLHDITMQSERVTVHELREAFGERSFGPAILVPALIEVSPIGAIPGLPTLIAIIIVFFAIQILLGRKHLWLPDFIERRKLDAKKLSRGVNAIKPAARFVDQMLRPRMLWVTRRPGIQIVALIIIALCATVPVLEIVPFASSIPMGAIAFFGLSLLARDGLLALMGIGLSAGAAYLVMW